MSMNVFSIDYSCSNTSIPQPAAGTVIFNNGTKVITNYCYTDNCNTDIPTDNATLWCSYGEGTSTSLSNQSCTGQCAVMKNICLRGTF
jgi:hypothetical protein